MPPTQRRLLVSIVLLNAFLLLAYLWSASEETTFTVEVRGNRLTASVNGYAASVVDGAPAGDRIGLYVAGFEDSRTYDAAGPSRDSPLHLVGEVAARLRQEPLGTTWSKLMVSRAGIERETALGAGWQPAARGGRALLLGTELGDYDVRLSLARGATPVGVLFRAGDMNNGLLLLIRPEHRDMMWLRIANGRWQDTLAGGGWSKMWLNTIQDNLRVLLVTQQVAFGVVLILLASAWLVSAARSAKRVVDRAFSIKSGVAPAGAAPDCGGIAGERRLPPRALGGQPPRTVPIASVLAIVLALSVAGVTAYIAYFILEAIPHVQDSVTYLFQAKVFALGRLWVPAPLVPEAFQQEFIVNFAGRAFSKYPPGHSLMLLPGVLAGAPWLINPLQAGLTVFVTYEIGRTVCGRLAGLMAAGLVASSPFFLFMSGSFMAHPTGLLFVLLFTLLFLRIAGRTSRDRLARPTVSGVLAGLALGAAFVTRPFTAVAIALPFAAYAAYRVIRTRGDEMSRYGPIVLGLLPAVVGMVIYNYALTGMWLKNPMELWWDFDKIGFGPGIGISGYHSLAAGLWNTYRNLSELTKDLFGWPAYATLALALAPFLLLRARPWDILFGSAALALMVAHIAWWADGVMYGPRYYYEAIGFLALLTARGVIVLAQVTKQRIVKAVPYALVLGLIGYNLAFYLPEQWPLHRGYNYVTRDKLRAVEAQQIHNAVVFVDAGQWYEWWNYGSVFSANAPTLDGDVVYARDRGIAENRRVMALYPDRRYYRLNGTTLKELAVGG